MIKVSDAVRAIVTGNTFLTTGLHYRMLNLTQVARMLKNAVEARCYKEVGVSAILMSLSRIQGELSAAPDWEKSRFVVDKLNIHTGLCSLTYLKTGSAHLEISQAYASILKRQGFMTVTEGVSEITVILEADNQDLLLQSIREKPRLVHGNLASVGVKFNQRLLAEPGVLSRMLQQVALQNINVIEITSTATEFNFYVDEADVRLAFDTLFNRFSKTGAAPWEAGWPAR